ncbi:MAG: hypothetical protein CM1200mP15_12760 [Dehalococcoidia bacterium]|nr:MAG: hypothetical protein CM1200mP15_12760 [Dehalococcoidia bacterium]
MQTAVIPEISTKLVSYLDPTGQVPKWMSDIWLLGLVPWKGRQ